MGSADRIIRLVIAAAIFVVYFTTNMLTGLIGTIFTDRGHNFCRNKPGSVLSGLFPV